MLNFNETQVFVIILSCIIINKFSEPDLELMPKIFYRILAKMLIFNIFNAHQLDVGKLAVENQLFFFLGEMNEQNPPRRCCCHIYNGYWLYHINWESRHIQAKTWINFISGRKRREEKISIILNLRIHNEVSSGRGDWRG